MDCVKEKKQLRGLVCGIYQCFQANYEMIKEGDFELDIAAGNNELAEIYVEIAKDIIKRASSKECRDYFINELKACPQLVPAKFIKKVDKYLKIYEKI